MKKLLFLATLLILSCKSFEVSKTETRYLLNNEDKKDKYYLVELIRQKQSENKLGETPMIVLGSKIISCWDGEKGKINISKEDIKKIKVIDMKKVSKSYGASGKYGVVIISKNKKSKKSKSNFASNNSNSKMTIANLN